MDDPGEASIHYLCMDMKREFGRRLRRAMDDLDLTLDELAERVPIVGRSALGNYAAGSRWPENPETFLALSRALGVPAAYLACYDDDTSMTARERAVIERYRRTDRRGRDAIERTAADQPPHLLEAAGSDIESDDQQP